MSEDRFETEVADVIRSSAEVELPPTLAARVADIPARIPTHRSRRGAIGATAVIGSVVVLAAVLIGPRNLGNGPAVGPSGSTRPATTRVLSLAELRAVISEERTGGSSPRDVVADVSIDSSHKTAPLARGCDPYGQCQVIGTLAGFADPAGTVTIQQEDRVLPPASDAASLQSPVALRLTARGPIEFLGHVRLSASGSLVWPVAAALADTATAPDEQVIAVEGWLDGLGGVPCGPAPDPSLPPPPALFQVPCREYITPDPRHLVAPDSGGGNLLDIPQPDGVSVGMGAYSEYAVDPSFSPDQDADPRKAVYLIRMVTYQAQRSWMVVGRLDPNAATATTPAGPVVRSPAELEQLLATNRSEWIGRTLYVDGTVSPGTPQRCPASATCDLGTLTGTSEEVVASPYTVSMLPAEPDSMTTGVLAVTVRENDLEYLGYAAWNTDNSFMFTPSQLDGPDWTNHAPLMVVVASGWLVDDGIHPCGPPVDVYKDLAGTPFDPCPRAWLAPTDVQPVMSDGSIVVPSGAIRIQPGAYSDFAPNPSSTVINASQSADVPRYGTFLLRLVQNSHAVQYTTGWQMVARLDPEPTTIAAPTVTSLPGPTPTPVATPTPTPSAPPASASAPAPASILPQANPVVSLGLSGSAGWALDSTGLSTSADAGRTWTTVGLPSGVAPVNVAAVATAPGRPLWLAVAEGDGYRLYSEPGGTTKWSSLLLTPTWSFLPSTTGRADMVKITPGPGSLVTVTETISGGMTSADTSLFVSADDGKSFAQHPPRPGESNMYWASVTFVSARSGLVIAGPDTYPHDFLYTTDGGDTWAESKVTGIVAAPYNQPGAPIVLGSNIVVPVNECDTDCSDGKYTFMLLDSHDGGASFNPEGTSFPSSGLGWSAVGTDGRVIWVIDGGAIHETADGGATWASVPTSSLSFEALDVTSPTTATAIAIDSGCAGFKTNCWFDHYIVFTTDGGRTWSRA